MAESIGISFGNNYCIVAHHDLTTRIISTGPNNEDYCRSCVAIDKNGNFVVGNSVHIAWKRYTPNIVISPLMLLGARYSDSQIQKFKSDKTRYPFGISKRFSNCEDEIGIILGGKEYTPEQICAEILKTLKNDAETKLGDVECAVITVPAYFNEKQLTAVRKAAKLAGLKIRLLPEPLAAAISYGFDNLKSEEDKTLLIYDFGGSKFDLSILKTSDGQFRIAGTGGDRWLGGNDINRIISEYVFKETEKISGLDIHNTINSLPEKTKQAFLSELMTEVESAKKALSKAESATISIFDYLESEDGDPIDIDITLTRSSFEDMISPLIQRTIDSIEDLLSKTSISADDISNILLVGGSSCIPLVRKMLISQFGEEKILYSENPIFAAAKGAAILAYNTDVGMFGSCIDNDKDIAEYCNKESQESSNSIVQETGYKTKHRYYLKTNNDCYQCIVDWDELLPYEVNVKHSLNNNNGLIDSLDVFSDSEDGSYERICTIYAIPNQKVLPSSGHLLLKFTIDEYECLHVNASLFETKQSVSTYIGRGGHDSLCLNRMKQIFDNIKIDNPNYSKQHYLDLLTPYLIASDWRTLYDRFIMIEKEYYTNF